MQQQLPAGLGPQENRKACWAGTPHRASGSSSGSLPYPPSRGLPVDLSPGPGLAEGTLQGLCSCAKALPFIFQSLNHVADFLCSF